MRVTAGEGERVREQAISLYRVMMEQIDAEIERAIFDLAYESDDYIEDLKRRRKAIEWKIDDVRGTYFE